MGPDLATTHLRSVSHPALGGGGSNRDEAVGFGRRIATVFLGGLLLIEVFALVFNATTEPAVFRSLGAWRWPGVSALAALMLGWAILVFQGSLFFTDRRGGSDHRLGFLLARLGAGRAPAMTAIDAPVQPRSSRLRRFGTGCLGLALIYLCFEWTRIGAITQAIRIVSRPIVSRP